MRPGTDQFPPGRSFFFIFEADAELFVDASAFDAVGGLQQSGEVRGVSKDDPHVGFDERRDLSVGPPPSLDDRVGGGDACLHLAGLGRGELGIHAGPDGGGEPVEFDLQSMSVVARLDHFAWFRFCLVVGFERAPRFEEATGRSWPLLTHTITVMVDNVDAHFEQAEREGAAVLSPPKDQPWGVRSYAALDPEGHQWEFATVANSSSSM